MKHGMKKQERERKREVKSKKVSIFFERGREVTFQVNRKMI